MITDAWGDAWIVMQARPTRHGFDLFLGKPPRVRQGATTIVTSELLCYLDTRRYPKRGVDLPIGRTTVKRLRRLLGHDWLAEHALWWEARAADLCDLTLEAFAKKHDVHFSSVANMRLEMLGTMIRPLGWWRHGEPAALLSGDLPSFLVAQSLGLTAGSVRRLRWALRQEAGAA